METKNKYVSIYAIAITNLAGLIILSNVKITQGNEAVGNYSLVFKECAPN